MENKEKLKNLKREKNILEKQIILYEKRKLEIEFKQANIETKKSFVWDPLANAISDLEVKKNLINQIEGETKYKTVGQDWPKSIFFQRSRKNWHTLNMIDFRGFIGKNKMAFEGLEKEILVEMARSAGKNMVGVRQPMKTKTTCAICKKEEKLNVFHYQIKKEDTYEPFWEEQYKENIKYLTDRYLYVIQYTCCENHRWFIQSPYHNVEYEKWEVYCNWLRKSEKNGENNEYSEDDVPPLLTRLYEMELSPVRYIPESNRYSLKEDWENKLTLIKKIAFGLIKRED